MICHQLFKLTVYNELVWRLFVYFIRLLNYDFRHTHTRDLVDLTAIAGRYLLSV